MSRIRAASAFLLLLLLAALLTAGCGGDESGSGDAGSGGGSGAEADDGGDGGDGGSSGDVDAQSLFVSTCGGCHTLSDAGTTGTVGPNLDELSPDTETVRTAIDEGRGAMPPDLLEGEEADAVAEYVAEVAGQ